MKRIYFLLSILLLVLTASAQTAWIFNRGDSLSWQPIQDMTVTFEKDPSGFFWQNIKNDQLDNVRMPIYTNDGILFAETPFLQVEKNYIEVTNEGNRQFVVKLKTNINDWSTIACQTRADWLKLVDTNDSQFPIIVYTFKYDANYTGGKRETQITFSRNDIADVVNVLSIGESVDLRKVLMDLYNATNGDNWTNNTNWGSDKPYWEWYGIEVDEFGNVCRLNLPANNLVGTIPENISDLSMLKSLNLSCNKLSGEIPSTLGLIKSLDYLDLQENELTGNIPLSLCELKWVNFVINNNHLSGQFPEELSKVMSKDVDITRFGLHGNYFNGKIPEAIVKHPKFKNLWTEFLGQYGDIDTSDLILQAPDFSVMDIDGDVITSSQLYKNNKLTLLYNWEAWCSYSLAFNEKLIPAYNQLHKKGFEVLGLSILCDNALPCVDMETYRTYLQEKTVTWKNVNQSPGENWVPILYACASPQTVLVNQDGIIISQSLTNNGGEDYNNIIPRLEEFFGVKIDNAGYTSIDYSKDGEVLILQTAEIENGIDIVLIGEAFVDKDMESGGKYEQKMMQAMEQFFSIEPYTSLRSRFNVYAVKVVSPNAELFASDAKHAINESNEKAFEYAKKALGEDAKRMMVGVIYNTDVAIDRSQTTMYEDDNSFVAYMMDGVSNVLNHEMGGHGLAFLLDEYVEQGMEDSSPSDEAKVALDAAFAAYGEGANVDWRNDPSEVKWAHFLNDSRYASEGLGVYEGAWFYGHGVYRPTENSMMRYNDCGFNAPSREAIYKRVMKLSEGDSWTYDYETFVTFDTPAREAYRQSRAKARAKANTQLRRVESRPPTIIKGTWRDAGKYENKSKL